ncbi:Putative uncharacterized protein [Escherichia coli D6-117.29]|nr:Putative uncharacterized protein [Escherichia coli D6-117.29]
MLGMFISVLIDLLSID